MSSLDSCTLETCSIDESILEYRPSLAANSAFIALFGLGLVVHAILGARWRTWFFTGCIMCGCAIEMIGYGGRVMMWENPFNYEGFIIQIVCITFAPVFYTASIYLTLYASISQLGTKSRYTPKFYYVVFIICDLISLVLQAVGGAMSSESSGSSQNGVDISLAGLCFQVFSLTVFIALSIDYALSYLRDVKTGVVRNRLTESRYRLFLVFLALATLCIYTRCVYRIAELSDGYSGPMIRQQGPFIGLEGVLIVVSVAALSIGNPGFVYKQPVKRLPESYTEMITM